MTQLRSEAQRLASAGRHGDSELVHMSPEEVDVLASTGRLSINPETGLPEAFGIGDLFKGIGSIGAGILGTAFGGPLGAALASGIFTGVTEKNVKKGLLSGMLGFAGGKALDAAVKAGTPGVTDVVRAGADMAPGNPDVWMPALGQNASRMDRAGSFLKAIPGAFSKEGGSAAASALTEGRMPFMLYPQIGNVLQSIDQDSGGGDTWEEDVQRYRDQYNRYQPGRSMYGARIQNRYRGGGHVGYGMTKNNWAGGGLLHSGIGAYAEGGSVSPAGYSSDDGYDWRDDFRNNPDWKKQGDEGLGGYLGRLTDLIKDNGRRAKSRSGAMEWASATFGPTQSNAPPPGYIPGYMPEFQYITPQGVDPDNPAEWAQPMGANPFDMSGVSPILDQGRNKFLMELSQGAYPGALQPPPVTGGMGGGTGGVVDPGITRALPRSFAEGGMIDGPGMGGMADTVPGMIAPTGEPALLSEGEFVVPADVVSMLGDGDSNSGARILEQMIAQVRMQKTGSPEQAPPMQAPPMDPTMMGAI